VQHPEAAPEDLVKDPAIALKAPEVLSVVEVPAEVGNCRFQKLMANLAKISLSVRQDAM
tara:strand:- start:392 stop:568 length:177 start_codon:yes stop_codon:yes gene_type:complete